MRTPRRRVPSWSVRAVRGIRRGRGRGRPSTASSPTSRSAAGPRALDEGGLGSRSSGPSRTRSSPPRGGGNGSRLRFVLRSGRRRIRDGAPDDPGRSRMNFAVATETRETSLAIALAGEVDLYTAPGFKQELVRAIESGARNVVIDLTTTTLSTRPRWASSSAASAASVRSAGSSPSSSRTGTSARSSRSPASTGCSRSTRSDRRQSRASPSARERLTTFWPARC